MVKPLNKEWELFGRKYRVAGAKGDKVDCNACQKQVSAAVNRLQSHLRVCPARPTLPPVALADLDDVAAQQQAQDMQQEAQDAATGNGDAELGDATSGGIGMHVGQANALGDASVLTDTSLDHTASVHSMLPSATGSLAGNAVSSASATGTATSAVGNMQHEVSVGASNVAPAAKRQKTTPSLGQSRDSRPRWSQSVHNTAAIAAMDDFWLTGTPQPLSSSAYAKRRLEVEEKRLLLEMKRDQREERRELLHLELLEAQVRRERLAAEKEAYEAKVLLALSRKQLRDQGVSEDEIDRILPADAAAPAAATTPADGEC
uniref:BED-type domain-containing protein n=1 Tax=Globisporangium ultimum (strain ATCC 200006 / CBS 805.95 / DAOM BR144) TaxID=431595 RepID=K3X167_GLOUD